MLRPIAILQDGRNAEQCGYYRALARDDRIVPRTTENVRDAGRADERLAVVRSDQ